MKSPGELTELFRGRGLRVTPQRQCLFRLLEDSAAHPTAETLYQQARAEMPTISLKTVYQTLNELASMGEVGVVDVGNGPARFDPNLTQHHHVVCERCGRTDDIDIDTSALRLPTGMRRHYTVERPEVVFRGVCSDCSAREEKDRRA